MTNRTPAGATAGPLALTILGSGGPQPTPNRVSSSAVVWVDGRPSILVDAGGGTFERIGRLGIDPAELDVVLLTHTHIDHSGGLAPVVFAAWMNDRDRPLTIVGPTGRDQHPGTDRFSELLFGPNGAWSYLHTFDGFAIDAVEAAAEPGSRSDSVWTHDSTVISAVGVAHGMMPALAFRIDHTGRSVCFTGDLEGAAPALVDLARDVDVLVHDQALPRRGIEHGHLHPPPADTAANATAAGARHLVLTHWMPPGDDQRSAIAAQIGVRFPGTITIAEDLMTIPIGPDDGQLS